MQTYRCPQCQNEIPLTDVNVASDLALCRKCGKTTPFSLVSGVSELDLAQLDEPMKGVTVTQAMIGGTEIVYRRFSKSVFFLIPFVAVWGGFSLGGIYGRQFSSGHFDPTMSLFGLPFLIGTLVMIVAILFMIRGRWRIRLDGGRGEVFAAVGPIGWTRRFAYGRDSVVSLELSKTQRNDRIQKVISVKTGNSGIQFGTPIQDDAKRYIAALIAKECAAS